MKQYAYILIMCLTATLSQNIIALELIKAIKEKKYKKVRQLIHDGADVSYHTQTLETPLHCAAYRGLVRITKLLLKHGACTDALAWDGSTPLCCAIGRFKTMELLLRHGANANGLCPFKNPLARTIENGKLECTKLLVQYGADPTNIRYEAHRTTALHIAAYHGRKRILKYFLEYGIPVNVANEAGRTPLGNILDHHDGFYFTRTECIPLLLDHGADAATYVHVSYSTTPMHEFIRIWAYARAQGKEDGFISSNKHFLDHNLLDQNIISLLEQDTRTARLRMLCIKHGVRNTQDLLFKRETGMIRLP